MKVYKQSIIHGEICITSHIISRVQYKSRAERQRSRDCDTWREIHILTCIVTFIIYLNLESSFDFNVKKNFHAFYYYLQTAYFRRLNIFLISSLLKIFLRHSFDFSYAQTKRIRSEVKVQRCSGKVKARAIVHIRGVKNPVFYTICIL